MSSTSEAIQILVDEIDAKMWKAIDEMIEARGDKSATAGTIAAFVFPLNDEELRVACGLAFTALTVFVLRWAESIGMNPQEVTGILLNGDAR